MKKLKKVIILLIVLVIAICIILGFSYSKTDLRTVSSKKTLNRLYNNYSTNEFTDYLIRTVTMPWSLFYNIDLAYSYSDKTYKKDNSIIVDNIMRYN